MGRYSMAGLEMYGDDLGAWMDAEALKDSLMAGGAGAVGILATSKILSMDAFSSMSDDATTNSRIKSLLAIGIGVLGGRAIYMYNRDAGMGFVGGVAGAGLAALIASWAGSADDGTPYLTTGLSGHRGLSDMDLSALEATVATNSPAWRAPGLSAPDVATQQLQATYTSSEEIAAYGAYMNQGVAPPSF